MQEKPSIRPPVVPEKRPIYLSVLNIITALCLVLFTYLAFTDNFDPGSAYHPGSFSVAWQTVQDGLQSGVMDINDGFGLSAILCFFPLVIWGVIVVVITQIASRRKRPSAKKSALIWAIILLGITVFLMWGLLALNSLPCVDLTPDGSDPTCAMPIRPGVSVPTPFP